MDFLISIEMNIRSLFGILNDIFWVFPTFFIIVFGFIFLNLLARHNRTRHDLDIIRNWDNVLTNQNEKENRDHFQRSVVQWCFILLLLICFKLYFPDAT